MPDVIMIVPENNDLPEKLPNKVQKSHSYKPNSTTYYITKRGLNAVCQ